jgi:hypothetical protein
MWRRSVRGGSWRCTRRTYGGGTGGFKDSGVGRDLGSYALMVCCASDHARMGVLTVRKTTLCAALHGGQDGRVCTVELVFTEVKFYVCQFFHVIWYKRLRVRPFVI